MSEQYAERGVSTLVIDVMEPAAIAAAWAKKAGFTFPVLLDPDGSVAESFGPPDALPDLPRNQVVIAANLIIDREGRIRFFTLLDSVNFDARLIALRAKLDQLLSEEGTAQAAAPPLTVTAPEAVVAEPGSRREARFEVTVRDGFHVQANPASERFLVPLRLELPGNGAVEVDEAVYPAGRPHRLRGASRDLSVYGGSFALTVPLVVGASAVAGEVRLVGSLQYQACSDRVCLRPSQAPIELRVRVGPPPE